MSDDTSNEKREPQVARRDTTFDGVIPERIWLTYNNRKNKYDGLVISIEVNGIEKELNKFKYYDYEDGHICGAHNLTWILEPLKAHLQQANETIANLKARKLRCGECGNVMVSSHQVSYLDEIAALRSEVERIKTEHLHNPMTIQRDQWRDMALRLGHILEGILDTKTISDYMKVHAIHKLVQEAKSEFAAFQKGIEK